MLNQNNKFFHKSALLKETIDLLNVKPGEVYIDATLGGAGHAEAILKNGGMLLGIDRDPEAVAYAKERLGKACPTIGAVCPNAKYQSVLGKTSWQVTVGNFTDLTTIAKNKGINTCSGILLDLGTSFHQLEAAGRGFSFNRDETLDMRMSPELMVKAADLINGLGEKELEKLFSKLGEERLAKAIAKKIVIYRTKMPITKTIELAELIREVYEKYHVFTKINPATKVFQALRIAVNDELNNLNEVLSKAKELLVKGGRLAVISFHGLEDRIVKQFFNRMADLKEMSIITEKPIVPTISEQQENPRCRSAKLRVAQKL